MEEKREISDIRLDLLKELGTICTARAATALSEFLNNQVDITVPEVTILPLEDIKEILGNPEEVYFVLDIFIEGGIEGRIFFLLLFQDAKILGGRLLNKNPDQIDIRDPLFQSAIKEIVNILTGNYLSVISDMTKIKILYNVPRLGIDMVGALLDLFLIHISQTSEKALFIRTNLKVREDNVQGLFLFFPNLEPLKKMFGVFGI